MKSPIFVGHLRNTDCANRVPVLTEALRLSRCKERKIRLIVCVNSGHHFDVGPLVVRRVATPRITKIMVPPGPLLLPRRDMRVSYGHKPTIGSMIVPAKEIALAAR